MIFEKYIPADCKSRSELKIFEFVTKSPAPDDGTTWYSCDLQVSFKLISIVSKLQSTTTMSQLIVAPLFTRPAWALTWLFSIWTQISIKNRKKIIILRMEFPFANWLNYEMQQNHKNEFLRRTLHADSNCDVIWQQITAFGFNWDVGQSII